MVAAMIPDMPVGTEFQDWPLHMTVAPWFSMSTQLWHRFDAGMKEILEETIAPTITGGTADLFSSPRGSVGVRKLDVPTQTFNIITGFNIHAGVIELAKATGRVEDTEYTGLNWTPHVSDASGATLAEGETVQISGLSVVKKQNERTSKVVKALYKWSDL
jgi:hypothetical protein